MLVLMKSSSNGVTPEQRARAREERETPRTNARFYTPAMARADDGARDRMREPKLEMLFTAFRDQSGALYFLPHSEDPIRLGINLGRSVLPPMVIATTDADMELIGESTAHQIMRHVNGTSRAARLANLIQRELARLPVSGPDVRRRIRGAGKSAA